jgi:hypothetical protein
MRQCVCGVVWGGVGAGGCVIRTGMFLLGSDLCVHAFHQLLRLESKGLLNLRLLTCIPRGGHVTTVHAGPLHTAGRAVHLQPQCSACTLERDTVYVARAPTATARATATTTPCSIPALGTWSAPPSPAPPPPALLQPGLRSAVGDAGGGDTAWTEVNKCVLQLVRACVRACVRVCVRACVRVCACERVCDAGQVNNKQ